MIFRSAERSVALLEAYPHAVAHHLFVVSAAYLHLLLFAEVVYSQPHSFAAVVD
ncbi:hypothetical protein D3C76_1075400 [compost metagenome]